jgi:hypothetical protein
MSYRRRKIITCLILVVGTLWTLRGLSSLTGADRRVGLSILAIIDSIGLMELTFAATIAPEGDGIRVDHFGTYHMNFEEVRGCTLVSFFPQPFVLVRTSRRFPLNILFCPVTLEMGSGANVESIKLVDFLRSHCRGLRGP